MTAQYDNNRETSTAANGELKPEFKIRKESAPQRCEICHQSDQLDFDTGQCQRCSNQALQLPIAQSIERLNASEQKSVYQTDEELDSEIVFKKSFKISFFIIACLGLLLFLNVFFDRTQEDLAGRVIMFLFGYILWLIVPTFLFSAVIALLISVIAHIILFGKKLLRRLNS
jgi:hypothetical protein